MADPAPAGPDPAPGGTEVADVPAGTAYIAVSGPAGTQVHHVRLGGDRAEVGRQQGHQLGHRHGQVVDVGLARPGTHHLAGGMESRVGGGELDVVGVADPGDHGLTDAVDGVHLDDEVDHALRRRHRQGCHTVDVGVVHRSVLDGQPRLVVMRHRRRALDVHDGRGLTVDIAEDVRKAGCDLGELHTSPWHASVGRLQSAAAGLTRCRGRASDPSGCRSTCSRPTPRGWTRSTR